MRKRYLDDRRIGFPKGIVTGALGFLGAVYVGVSIYFLSHFAFNTVINHEDAFGKNVKALQNEVVERAKQYSITIYGRNDVKDVISAADISLKPEFGTEFEELLHKQMAFLWPVYLFKTTEYTTDTVADYSQQELYQVASSLTFFNEENMLPPENAHISEVSGDDGFEIIREKDGSMPVKDALINEIASAIDILETEHTLSDDCYVKAQITEEDPYLITLRDNMNEYCSANITYEFGADTVKVDGNQILEWCYVDGTEVTLDENKVRDFVNSLAKKYDTFGKTRHFTTHDGEEVEVSGGDYGWWMNRGEETAELINAVKNGEKGVRTPVYYGTASCYGEKDWGDTYVEIDLDKQHLWVYENGKVVEESDFVSGCVNKRTTTPVGTYGITYKERDATLNGENYSSAVDYWMPFNGNVGMHDASWRKSFGEEIYVTNGSHGCINLPTKKAAAIYDIVTKGEPVLVFGGKTLPEKEEEEEPDPEELLAQLAALAAQGEAAGAENAPQTETLDMAPEAGE